MKNLFILILALLCKTAFSQQVVEAYLFADKERPILEKFVNNDSLTAKELKACTRLRPDRDFIDGLFKSNVYDYTAVKNDVIVIVLKDIATKKLLPIGGANIGSVTYKFEGKSDVPIIATQTGNYIRFEMAELLNTPSGNTLTEVTVKYKDTAGADKTSVIYFRYLKQFSNYGAQVFDSPLGIWLPVGQFGSNLKKTDKGMIFNALPIGVALGTKLNLAQKFYLGFSYSLDYTITGGGGDDLKTYSFWSFSHGPLFDIGDYAHIGYNSFTNLSTDPTKNREPFWVVGIGSKVLQALKGKK